MCNKYDFHEKPSDKTVKLQKLYFLAKFAKSVQISVNQRLTGYPKPPIPKDSSNFIWAPASVHTHLEVKINKLFLQSPLEFYFFLNQNFTLILKKFISANINSSCSILLLRGLGCRTRINIENIWALLLLAIVLFFLSESRRWARYKIIS